MMRYHTPNRPCIYRRGSLDLHWLRIVWRNVHARPGLFQTASSSYPVSHSKAATTSKASAVLDCVFSAVTESRNYHDTRQILKNKKKFQNMLLQPMETIDTINTVLLQYYYHPVRSKPRTAGSTQTVQQNVSAKRSSTCTHHKNEETT